VAKGLSREKLVGAALGLVDREGLSALSMRRLGTELGVDPMAAYRHFPNKEVLLDGVMEAVLSEVDLDIDESMPWQAEFRALVRAYFSALLQHPNAIPLITTRLFTTSGTLRVVNKGLEIAARAGIPPHEASLMVTSAGLLANGVALFATSPSGGGRSPEEDAGALSVLPREEFAAFLAAAESGEFVSDFQAILDFGLDSLIARLSRQRGRIPD
jgi:AcrR family transcriptional regulator